ncbi:MAG: nitroreductase family protein [Acidimicrobiales bacterium]
MIHLDPPAELAMPLAEAMFTQRAIRRLDPDRPVTDAELELVLDAASKAPSGANTQPARFLVIRDRARIEAFGRLYHEAWWAKRADELGWTVDQEVPADSPYRMAAVLAAEMRQAPVVILAFAPGRRPEATASSVFPAIQNLMLAARALGLGSVLTTLHPSVMERVHALLGVPDDVSFHACIPLGRPRGNFGPTRRRPTAETTSWDTWGSPPPWAGARRAP